jgi:hypothetical protein
MGKQVWQDIIDRETELRCREWVYGHAPRQVLEHLERAANRPWIVAADGAGYRDAKIPYIIADESAVTLSTTSLLLHSMQYTSLPANYFTPGKLLCLTIMGRATTAATPGNFTFELRFGTTSAGGTILATSAAIAAGASKTNITWMAQLFVRCRAIGSSGSLLGWGQVETEPSSVILPAANNPAFLPATAPAATTVDTTAASGINLQLKRSGSTAETAQVHDITFEALN